MNTVKSAPKASEVAKVSPQEKELAATSLEFQRIARFLCPGKGNRSVDFKQKDYVYRIVIKNNRVSASFQKSKGPGYQLHFRQRYPYAGTPGITIKTGEGITLGHYETNDNPIIPSKNEMVLMIKALKKAIKIMRTAEQKEKALDRVTKGHLRRAKHHLDKTKAKFYDLIRNNEKYLTKAQALKLRKKVTWLHSFYSTDGDMSLFKPDSKLVDFQYRFNSYLEWEEEIKRKIYEAVNKGKAKYQLDKF